MCGQHGFWKQHYQYLNLRPTCKQTYLLKLQVVHVFGVVVHSLYMYAQFVHVFVVVVHRLYIYCTCIWCSCTPVVHVFYMYLV